MCKLLKRNQSRLKVPIQSRYLCTFASFLKWNSLHWSFYSQNLFQFISIQFNTFQYISNSSSKIALHHRSTHRSNIKTNALEYKSKQMQSPSIDCCNKNVQIKKSPAAYRSHPNWFDWCRMASVVTFRCRFYRFRLGASTTCEKRYND